MSPNVVERSFEFSILRCDFNHKKACNYFAFFEVRAASKARAYVVERIMQVSITREFKREPAFLVYCRRLASEEVPHGMP